MENLYKNSGYWISPNNEIFKLNPDENHLSWIKDKGDIKDLLKEGWIRIRIQGYTNNYSVSLSYFDEKSLNRLPKIFRDIINNAKEISCVDLFQKKVAANRISIRDSNKLEIFNWEEGTIQVRSKINPKKEIEILDNGKERTIYDPYFFDAYIFTEEKSASIEDCHVHPKYRGQGIAKEFIDTFLNLCKAYRVKRIDGVAYESAVNFWEKMGFKIDRDEYNAPRITKKLAQLLDLINKPTENDEDGNKYWKNKEGELHRENDKPAIEYKDGQKVWYKNGIIHRENNKPAIEWADGGKAWYINGMFIKRNYDKNGIIHNDKFFDWDGDE
jgi:GNAT superfamily N-acetyltransferase